MHADSEARRLKIALALILAFMAAEIVVALLASSLALLSDAAHMLTDAAALAMALFAARLAARPAGGAMTFGLGRAEIISANANGMTLLVLGLLIVYGAIRHLIAPIDVQGAPVLVVALVGIVVNLIATRVLGGHGHGRPATTTDMTTRPSDHDHGPATDRPRRSLNIEGSYRHLLTDLFGFAATAVAAVVILLTGFHRADAIASLLIAAVMLHASYGLIRASARVMMEAAPEGIDPDAIGRALAAYPGVAEVHDLHIWEVTSGFSAISAHIVVDAGHDCHEIRRALSQDAARPVRARALDPAGRTRTRASTPDADRGGRPWRQRLTRSSATEEGSFRGFRARRIVWQSWSPAGDQQLKGVVTIAHGYGEHIGRYQHVAARLTGAGFAVYGLDHHGHGRSQGKRGRVSLRRAVADLDQLIVTVSRARKPRAAAVPARAQHGRRDRAALRDGAPGSADRARAVGAARGGRGRSGTARVGAGARHGAAGRAALAGRSTPGEPRPRSGQGLHRRSAEPPRPDPGRRRPRIHHACRERLAVDVRRITLPTLLMWGTADRLCPPAGSELVAANIGSQDLTVKPYEGLFHEIMNEPERDRCSTTSSPGWTATCGGSLTPAAVRRRH